VDTTELRIEGNKIGTFYKQKTFEVATKKEGYFQCYSFSAQLWLPFIIMIQHFYNMFFLIMVFLMSIKYPNRLYRSNILKIIVLDEPQVEDEKNVSTIKKELLILMPQVFKPGYSEMRSLRNRETEQI